MKIVSTITINDLEQLADSGCSHGCRNERQSTAAKVATKQELSLDGANGQTRSSKGGRTLRKEISQEERFMIAAKECRKVIQKCLREEEWPDADEAFAKIIGRYFSQN